MIFILNVKFNVIIFCQRGSYRYKKIARSPR